MIDIYSEKEEKTVDDIQRRIEFLKQTIKLLKVIVEFAAQYFPADTDFIDKKSDKNSSWEFL